MTVKPDRSQNIGRNRIWLTSNRGNLHMPGSVRFHSHLSPNFFYNSLATDQNVASQTDLIVF